MEFLWFLLLGAVAGWLAGLIMKGRGFGILGNILVGVVGAFVGGFLFRLLGLDAENTLGALLMATAGAVVLLAVVGALRKAA